MALTKAQGKFSQAINDGADATAITIDSSEKVGIGTTGPNQLLTLGSDTGSATIGLDFETTTVSRGSILYNAGAGEMAFTSGYSGYGGYMTFDCNGAERARILSGGGITFNGDTAAANALDGYEEGTWTPTAAGNISSISNAEGFYTRIGNVVTILYFADITPASSSTQLQLAGLPYAVANKLTGSNVEGTGVIFEDSNLYVGFALGNSTETWIELDRPIQGSSDTNNRSYRGSLVYYAA